MNHHTCIIAHGEVSAFPSVEKIRAEAALRLVVDAQDQKKVVAFIDTTHTLTIENMRGAGIDVGRALISQPDNLETALEIVDCLLRSCAVDVVVTDILLDDQTAQSLQHIAGRTSSRLVLLESP